MQTSFKVAVLGPIPYDHITTPSGRIIEKYGCVTHPAIALARLLEGKGEVYPVTHIRQQDVAPVQEVFAPYPNIKLDAVHSALDQGDVIELKFVDQNNRLEKQTAFMPPIRPQDLEAVLDADVFVCVPISDYEVPLETLRYIKENGKADALTIFDAHGPTTTVSTTGDRLRRFWIERDLWLPYIDILKMNIEEAGCCWFKKQYEPNELKNEYVELSEQEMDDFGQHVVGQGVKAMYITLDSRGAMLYAKGEKGFEKTFIKSVKVDEVIDTTGCGDSFAGGLGFGLLGNPLAYRRAAQYANALGALRTQGTTFEVFKSLLETNELIQLHYVDEAEIIE
ncbi:MAG: carbohydrate kinase family protein [Saprospiraceae bacterium]|nr:carbohydrate kinase family protein [Saprospiraceae bacterium]